MQEKDTVLEVKNLYKLFGPYDFLDERKAAFKLLELEPAGWTLWKRQVSWLRSAMFPSASKEVSFCTDRFIRQW